jgi:hypothetical protein
MTIEERIAALELRNKKVETNKAWETSWSRKVMLVVITYLVVALTLIVIQNPNPWINALIPALGFFLSTLTLPFIKTYWIKYIYRKNS